MKKILLIEDEENERTLYKSELEKDGYEVLCSSNGIEGCDVLKKEEIDLVILDIHMPGMDGIEAIGKILTRKRNMPIIIHTAFPQYKDQFLTWAADAYIMKSSNLRQLKTKIKELTETKEAREENEQ